MQYRISNFLLNSSVNRELRSVLMTFFWRLVDRSFFIWGWESISWFKFLGMLRCLLRWIRCRVMVEFEGVLEHVIIRVF